MRRSAGTSSVDPAREISSGVGEIDFEPAELGKELQGVNVKIRLTSKRPPPPTPSRELESIRHQLELIRLQGR